MAHRPGPAVSGDEIRMGMVPAQPQLQYPLDRWPRVQDKIHFAQAGLRLPVVHRRRSPGPAALSTTRSKLTYADALVIPRNPDLRDAFTWRRLQERSKRGPNRQSGSRRSDHSG